MGLIDNPSVGERRFGQLAGGRERVDLAKAGFQKLGLLVAPILETIGDGKAQFAVATPRREHVGRQEKVVEGAKRPAAFDPYIACLQAVAQRHHDRDLIGPAIDAGVGSHELAPCRRQERHRRMRRKFPRAVCMNPAKHVQRVEQGVAGFPGAERERAEQNGGNVPHRGMALHDLLQIVRARVGDRLVGFLDEGFQALPAERALHRRNLVFSLVLGRQHGFRHAEQRPCRSVEGLRARDDILLVLVLGAAEHGAEHLAEHGESGVGEDRFHLAREHDECRQAAMRVETRNMLRAENGRFPRNRRIARLMDAPLAIRFDAERARGLQAFDNADQTFLARRFRPFPQPRERRVFLFIDYRQQRLQRDDPIGTKALGQAFVSAFAGNGARRQCDFLHGGDGGQQNMLVAQMFDHRRNDHITAIRAVRLFERGTNNGARVIAPEWTHVEIGLQFTEMLPACFAAASV